VVSDEDGSSRRTLLTGAGATLITAGALALVGCGANAKTGQKAVKQAGQPVQRADLALLNSLIDLERHTVAAYTAGIPLLPRAEAKVAQQFLSHELQHTGELLSLIKAAGGPPPPRQASYDLGHPTNARQVLELLHGLERAQLNAYLYAIPRLSPAPLRAAAATILSNDSQHIAILRQSLGMVPVPSPFVTGRE
jgi:Ferritin-like domain